MPKEYFKFKQFTIFQDRCAMKVGTDGILLGCWADVKDGDTLLDVGTGTGLLAIMATQRAKCLVDAIEIERNSFLQALSNKQACKWGKQITIHNTSFQHFDSNGKGYDVIISNPPFYTSCLKSPNKSRFLARNSEALPLNVLIEKSKKLLNNNGLLAFILPWELRKNAIELLGSNHLFVQRECVVFSRKGKSPIRVLIEASKVKKVKSQIGEITIYNSETNLYTEEYLSMAKDFYLKF